MVAQVAALDHPHAFAALTLVGTRPVAPGRVDDDLPDHDTPTMDRLFSRPMPDWSDRSAVAKYAAAGAEILGDDAATARATAERIWDRTPSTEPAVQMANQRAGQPEERRLCRPARSTKGEVDEHAGRLGADDDRRRRDHGHAAGEQRTTGAIRADTYAAGSAAIAAAGRSHRRSRARRARRCTFAG